MSRVLEHSEVLALGHKIMRLGPKKVVDITDVFPSIGDLRAQLLLVYFLDRRDNPMVDISVAGQHAFEESTRPLRIPVCRSSDLQLVARILGTDEAFLIYTLTLCSPWW